jgi:hypothetical protein
VFLVFIQFFSCLYPLGDVLCKTNGNYWITVFVKFNIGFFPYPFDLIVSNDPMLNIIGLII